MLSITIPSPLFLLLEFTTGTGTPQAPVELDHRMLVFPMTADAELNLHHESHPCTIIFAERYGSQNNIVIAKKYMLQFLL
jgi:hypothetical protein